MAECLVVTVSCELATRLPRRAAAGAGPQSGCRAAGRLAYLAPTGPVGASGLIGLLTCTYVRFFIVSMRCCNQAAIFDSCERDLYVGKQSCIAQRYNRMAINRDVVLLNEEW
jgi:hypothetical protein